MKKFIFFLILSLFLADAQVPVSAFADPYARAIGDYSLLELVPPEISLGFPVYATRANINATSGFTKQEVLASPTGRKIQQTTLEIISGKLSDYDKAKAIHEWVYGNIRYDNERAAGTKLSDNNSSALKTFDEMKAICDGYNYLSALMLYFAGIPCVDYGGVSRPMPNGAEAHAWMAAFVDGKWVYFDPTWGEFGIPYDYHQNVELIRFSDGYYTFEWLVLNNTVGIRVKCVIPADVTEIAIPSAYDNTNVHAVIVYGEAGSYAEAYAKRNNLPFNAVTHADYIPDPDPVDNNPTITDPPITVNHIVVEDPAPLPITVNPTASAVLVNGVVTTFEAYNIDGNNFFKLRDIAAAINGTHKQFELGYDRVTLSVSLTSGLAYTPVDGELTQGDGLAKAAIPTASRIYFDGQELNFTVYNIGGNNFFKLRDLMSVLDIAVIYDEATRNISIDTSSGYVE